MKEYKVEVKAYMMRKSTPDFDFMAKWNDDIPMPLKIMYGVKVAETKAWLRCDFMEILRKRSLRSV
jgi:hypothetical protein